MKLVKHSQLNNRYFDKSSRPSKDFWIEAVTLGSIHGKIINGNVYIDEIDFLSRENLDISQQPQNNDDGIIDLLA